MTTLKEEMRRILHPENKMLNIAKERLKPPKPIVSEMSVPKSEEAFYKTDKEFIGETTPTDSKLAIDINSMPQEYWGYCDSNDAKRAWRRAKFGKVHRGTTRQLKRDVEKKNQDLALVEYMKKEKSSEYRGVVQEFKSKVAKLKEKRFE